MGTRAIFLDRDGVLTEPIFNPQTGEFESPHAVAELRFCPGIFEPLRTLAREGFALFIVSNQPSYAKGKATIEALQEIAARVEADFRAEGIVFADAYYCYHHPRGIVPGFSGPCACRKPEPFFLKSAAVQYDIDLARSWMIGDRGSDIECGQRAHCRTIRIAHRHAWAHVGPQTPDYVAMHLAEAVEQIIAHQWRGEDEGNR